MTPAEEKQRKDAEHLLPLAVAEHAEYVKTFKRLENNVKVFLERQNYELAALYRLIMQKEENIRTLEKMSKGYFVEPTPPVVAQQPEEKPKETKKEEVNGTTAEASHGQ